MEWHNSKCSRQWPWPKFIRSNSSVGYFDKYMPEDPNITIANRSEVRYLPSNGATTKVVHRVFDLHLLWKLYIVSLTYIYCESCTSCLWSTSTAKVVHRVFDLHLLRKLYVVSLTKIYCESCTSWLWPTFSKSGILKVNILATVRSSENCSSMTFTEIDICHQMGALRILYSVTLTFIFEVKHFHVMYLL